MTSGGCPQCDILTEVNRTLEVQARTERAEAIARLAASGVDRVTLAHAYLLPPETIDAIINSRSKT